MTGFWMHYTLICCLERISLHPGYICFYTLKNLIYKNSTEQMIRCHKSHDIKASYRSVSGIGSAPRAATLEGDSRRIKRLLRCVTMNLLPAADFSREERFCDVI